jgi:ectoine hydroxylase-related dioxygenase (phytanoyl-CoA dioxygenase family)
MGLRRMTKESGLSEDERRRLESDGFVAPLRLCSESEMAGWRAHIEAKVLTAKSPIASCGLRKSRHLDDAVVFALASHPAIIARARSLMGDNIVLWRTQFFVKEPGDKEVPWHHDNNFLQLDPVVNLSAWIAIDPADEGNSCLQVIPGSHKRDIPHFGSTPEMAFPEMADPAFYDSREAISVPLRPGEFILFSDRLLHHSAANSSPHRRLGFAVRLTHTGVRIDLHKTNPGQYGIVVSGQDTLALNRYAEPPFQAL